MELTDMQLDALREISNIGSGTAATALSSMLGRTVDLHGPARAGARARRCRRGRRPARGRRHRRRARRRRRPRRHGRPALRPRERGHACARCSASTRTTPRWPSPPSARSATSSAAPTSARWARWPASTSSRSRRSRSPTCSARSSPPPWRRPRWTPTWRSCSTRSCCVEGAECSFGVLFVPTADGVGRLLARPRVWAEAA